MMKNALLLPPGLIAHAAARGKLESCSCTDPENTCPKAIEKWLERHFFFRTAKGIILFALKDLIRVEAQKRKTHIYIANRPEAIVLQLGINRLEEALEGAPFLFRSHRSHLVNLFHFKEYQKKAGLLIMSSHNGENGTKSILADNRQAALQEAMERLGWEEIGGEL